MMNRILLKAFIASFLSINSSILMAEDNQFKGRIFAQIVEPNGHVYHAIEGFENSGQFSKKQFLKFRQERGQKVAMVGNKIIFDGENQNKYHLTVEVDEKNNERFLAKVKLFENSLEFDDKSQKKIVVSNLIKHAELKGKLNSSSKYQFVDDNQVNFNIEMNIDKVFNEEELRKRLEKFLPSKR